MLEATIAVIAVFILLILVKVRRITIYEYEKGVKYFRGKFQKPLDAGVHWYAGLFTNIGTIDIRPRFVTISGQEILSSDSVTLKISMAAQYEVKDIELAVNKLGTPYVEALYLILQLALREIITGTKIDDILETRNTLGANIMESASEKVEEIGLKLISADIKDVMFPGELKKIFSQVAKARQEGLAMLEKARAETAALRNLANSANMLKNNPALMQLRLLQSTGNTLVVGMPTPPPVTAVAGGESEETGKEE